MRIAVFCVNYNSYDCLKSYLDSLEEALSACPECELTVVCTDNSPNKQEIALDYSSFEVKMLQSPQNLGYFGGIEHSIRNLKKDLSTFDYFIVSNVDLTVDKKFFWELSNLDLDKNVGCIAPLIYSQTEQKNRNPESVYRYSKKRLRILKLLYSWSFLLFLYEKFFYKKQSKASVKCFDSIYAAHGSFFIFTKNALSFVATFHYPMLLYGEEIYVAEELTKKNLSTVYYDKLVINDIDHVSTSKMKSHFILQCHKESIAYLLRTYYSGKNVSK